MSGVTLALDTSTLTTGVAALHGTRHAERLVDAANGRPRHSGSLIELSMSALKEVGAGFDEVETVVVCVGPGSFTGIRVGVSIAKGVARGSGAKLIGVGSLRVLLAAAEESADGGGVVAMIDARRGELFVDGDRGKSGSGAPRTIPRADLAGLELEGRLCVGDGVEGSRDLLVGMGAIVPPLGDPLHVVSPGTMLRFVASPDCEGEAVLPVYLRDPDAVPKADR